MKINFHSPGFWKITSSVLLVTMFFTFNQCVVSQYDAPVTNSNSGDEVVEDYTDGNNNSGGTLPPGGSGEFEETGATEVARLVTDIGVKDFESIYFTYQVLTGVLPNNETNVSDAFEDLSSQLPFDATIKNFGTAQQIAIIKLASEFCHALFNRASLYNAFFNNFNIGQTPNAGLDNAGKVLMVQDFINRFWGVNVQPQEVELQALNEMTALIDDLLIGENNNSTATTRLVAKGVCTSLLASAPVTTL